MALGFTSHYSQSDKHPFGSLILSSAENETSGSVAYSSDGTGVGYSLLSQDGGDSCCFSVSVNIDYSQYASYVASSSGSTETAGSVAYSGGSFSSGGSVSFSGGGCSSGGSSGGGCSASFTC